MIRTFKYRRKTGLALLAILSLASILRFHGLEIQSLWVDELASAYITQPDNLGAVIERVREDVHPPGYYTVLYFSRILLGDGEWALRFPSAVAGVLSVFAMYLLGARLYSEGEGLMAALFTAVFFAPVYYSQEARSYSLLLLFAILTAYFWWGIYQQPESGRRTGWRLVTGYIAAAVACCYTHYFGLFLVALQGLAMLLLKPGSPRQIATLYLPVAVAYLPWVPVMVGQFRERPPNAASLDQYLDFLFNHSFRLQALICVIFLAAAFSARRDVAAAASRKSLDPLLPGLLLVAWFAGTFAVAQYISTNHTPILTARNLIVALPAAYLLVARSITRIFANRRAQAAAALGIATLFLVQMLFTMDYYAEPRKQQVREAVRFVVDHEKPATLVVHCGVGRPADYYYRQLGSDVENPARIGTCKSEDLPVIEKKVRDDGLRRVILVHAHLKPEDKLVEGLDREYDLVRKKKLVGAGARLYNTH